MAFRTVLSTNYRFALDTCTTLKTQLQNANAQMAAGPVSGNLLIDLHARLVSVRSQLVTISGLAGIGNFAKQQENDPDYDVAAEFTAVVAAIATVRDYIINNINTTSWVTFSNSGAAIKSFTSAQTAGLRSQIDSLIATLE